MHTLHKTETRKASLSRLQRMPPDLSGALWPLPLSFLHFSRTGYLMMIAPALLMINEHARGGCATFIREGWWPLCYTTVSGESALRTPDGGTG